MLMICRPALNRVDVIGISVYSSKDLLNWQHEGACQLLLYTYIIIYYASMHLARTTRPTIHPRLQSQALRAYSPDLMSQNLADPQQAQQAPD